jgi:dihydrofolate reductase
MKAIVAVNTKGYIGKDGEMMWKSKEDFKHFRNMTMGCKLLTGRKTADSMPLLKGRELYVASRKGQGNGTIEKILKDYTIDWVIGGEEIYNSTIHLCDELHVSIIVDNDDEGDKRFIVPDDYKGEIFYYYFTSDK